MKPLASLFAAALTLAAPPALADSSRFAADDPGWRAECGTCHTAFPPALMSAPAWRQVIGSLGRHYGTDASVDASTAAAITAFLDRNAGIAPRAAPASAPGDARLPRLADGAWFAREHRKVPAATLARPDVRGLTNCGACHAGADRNDFSEHAVRVPR